MNDWETLDPWDKAAKWQKVSPEVSAELLRIAGKRADDRLALEHRQAEANMELARRAQDHSQLMDVRLWLTQLVGIVGGLLCIAGLIVVAWHYADTGNIAPGIAVFSLGTGLTAGVFGVGRSLQRKRDLLPRDEPAKPLTESTQGPRNS